MRIDRIDIDGYGIFHEFALDDLSPALTVVLGQNEAGKTTLLSFIRTILFGFLDKRSANNLYEPLAGGNHGGRLGLVNRQDERFILERFAGAKGGPITLTLPDGSAGGQSDLDVLLGHTSRDLFRNVFAFSLTELQDFESLSGDDVRARIYGAGIGAGRLGLPEIEKKIEDDRGKLYKGGGSKQTIAGLIRKSDEVGKRLREIGDQVEEHDRLRSELETLDLEIDANREERQEAYADRDHTANLLRAWDDWTDLRSAQEQMNELPSVSDFPPDGISRLDGILQRRNGLRDRIDEIKGEITIAERELQKIDVDRDILAQSAEIEGLSRGLDKYESSKKDLPKRESELKLALVDLQGGLKDLGPGWTEERVGTFDTSVPARETVRSHGEALRATAERLRDAKRDADRAKDDRENASIDRSRLEKEWKALDTPPERDRNILEEERRKLRELRSLVSAHKEHRQEMAHKEDRKGDLEARGDLIERQFPREAISLPVWPAVLAPPIGLAAAAMLAVLTDGIAAPAIIVALGAVVGAGYLRLRSSLTTGPKKGAPKDDLNAVHKQLQRIEGEAATLTSLIETEDSSIRSLALQLGTDSSPDERSLGVLESELDNALESLRTWEAAEKRGREAAASVDERDERMLSAKEKENKAREEAQHAAETWQGWLEERNIDTTISPETCQDILSRIESLREKIKAIDNLRDQRVGAIQRDMEEYESRTNAVRRTCDIAEKPRSEFPGAVDQLIEALRTASKRSGRLQQLTKEIDDDTTKLTTIEATEQSVGEEIAALLAEGGASDEESFRRRADTFGQREELLTTIGDRRRNLERIVGHDHLDAFVSELEEVSPEQLQGDERQVKERIEELDGELTERTEERGRIGEQIGQIETEEESSGLRMSLSGIRERVASEARKWAVLTIGQALLEETRLKYERERRPAVMEEAERFFSSFTSGRYERILSPLGENQVAVVDRTGKRKDTSELSRGTMEQLYLALRFGLVREFARRAEPMPVIMDDILVNFDPERAREACRALGELSREQQVLLFTCHPGTVELMKSETADCKIIELSP
ncbi:MAG: AAA family ATPase [Chloroflexi bacterium]|nr:AAA family ATPase [Chloroflexota bacterium]